MGSPQPPPYARSPSPEFHTPPIEVRPIEDAETPPTQTSPLLVPPPVCQECYKNSALFTQFSYLS